MTQNKIKWFTGDKVQLEWANNYLSKPEVKKKLNTFPHFKPTSTHPKKDATNLLSLIEKSEGGSEFLSAMRNAWSKYKSNQNDPRKIIQLKISPRTFQNLKLLMKDKNQNYSEIIESLINQEQQGITNIVNKYEKKLEQLKNRLEGKISKICLTYEIQDKVPKAMHDDVKLELSRTKSVLDKISKTIAQLK